MNIIEAIKDERLFRPFLGGDLTSWRPWMTCLRAIYGLPIKSSSGRQFIREATGRDPDKLNSEGYSQSLMLTGRRSGKSRSSAIIGAYEAALSGREAKLAKGERGYVLISSPTKHQSNIVKSYIRGIFEAPLLRQEIVRETREGFELRNGVTIAILAGDWRTVRGFSLLAAIVDEVCFFGTDPESHVRSDTELINAIRPGTASTHGRIACISSCYARRGWAYQQWKRCFGNDDAQDTLVVNGPSRLFNPTLDQRIIDAAMRDDLAAARAEYGGTWREDCGLFIPRELVEKLVVADRQSLLPREKIKYAAFVDVSGGRGDDAALAIAHRHNGKIIVDYLGRWKAPFDPQQVVSEMVEDLRRYQVKRVTGDAYGADWVSSSFESRRIHYIKSEKNKSELYLEMMPRLCSGEIELLDHPALIDQLAALERRTRSGGRDIVDHPSGGKDDLANAVAGVAEACIARRITIGAI